MKKLWPTLLALVVLIGGYLYARQENFFKEQEKAAETLFTFKSGDVAVLKVTGDQPMELRKGDGGAWAMSAPAAYPVDKLNVEGWAHSLSALRVKSVIDEHASALADFGLEQPKQTVEATMADGSVQKLLVGNPLPVSGTTYVKAGDREAVYEVEDTQLQTVLKQPLDLVDKVVVKADYDKIKQLDMDWKGQKWTLTKSELDKKAYESAWRLGDRELKPDEGTRILDKLLLLADAGLPQEKSAVNWASPELRLTVKLDDGGKEAVQSYTGKLAEQVVRLAKDDGAWAYAVSVDDVQALYDLSKPPEPSGSPAASASPAAASPDAGGAPGQ